MGAALFCYSERPGPQYMRAKNGRRGLHGGAVFGSARSTTITKNSLVVSGLAILNTDGTKHLVCRIRAAGLSRRNAGRAPPV